MSGRLYTRCQACRSDWIDSRPEDSCQMITMPDEHTWLWWQCPDCGWQAIQLDQHNIATLHSYGVECVDWSDIEPDPAPVCSIVEWAHMIQVGEMDANRAAIIMVAAAERCIHEATR